MSVFKEFKVRSNIKNYYVKFVEDFSRALLEDSSDRCFFIIDKNVFQLYERHFHKIKNTARYQLVEAKESNKTLDYVNLLIKSLINNNIKKTNRLIAIGGGTIQDISGFIASILFRGIEWIFYPTTLLAQADSCIGSKTSINIDEYKNQIGTFYPPIRIVIDINFQKTLSPVDIKSGLGEIIKVHLLDGEKRLKYIISILDSPPTNPAMLSGLVFRSLMIKKRIIEKDEYDQNYRNILNYGHTFGHAIESLTDYSLCHGQAVTIGMDLANYLSLKLDILPEKSFAMMSKILEKNSPTISFDFGQIEPLFVALSKDKKNVDENVAFILTKGPGKMFKQVLPFDEKIKNIIRDYFLLHKRV